jgi:hypothetical protein
MAAEYKPSDVNLKVERGDVIASWSTKKVEQLLASLEEGYKSKTGTPFYENNPDLKKGNIVWEYTEHELGELKKCSQDIMYFANNYCTVMTDEGLQTIVLRDYQEEMLQHFQNSRFSVCLASRQIGKTICSSIFLAWYVTFNFDKNALVLSNKGATTREILDKANVIIDHLPWFMKPGVLKNDVFNRKFDNGCRIVGQATSKKAAIGFTIHLLFMDEFAHIHHSFLDTFYENVYPTISSSKISRVIITSTPNGFNKFYNIWRDASAGNNEYRPFRVDWWQVPGRDEEWMKREVSNLGSEEAFNRQYGNQFVASSNLLLSPHNIKNIQKSKKTFEYHDFYDLDDVDVDYKGLIWHPDVDIDSLKDEDRYYVFSIDIAEGNGGDYSVCNIFEIDMMSRSDFEKVTSPGSFIEFYGLSQLGLFRSNTHSIEDFAKIIYTLNYEIFEAENVKLVIEWNMFGSEFIRRLQTIFPQRNEFDEESVVKFKHRNDAKTSKFGLKLKRDNKAIFCQNFKKYLSINKIKIAEENTVYEACTFGKTPNGNYEGQMGNDDLIMTCINVTEFFHTLDFSDFVEEKFDSVDAKFQDEIETILDKDSKGGSLYFDIYDLV